MPPFDGKVIIELISILAIVTLNLVIGHYIENDVFKISMMLLWTALVQFIKPFAIVGYQTLIEKMRSALLNQQLINVEIQKNINKSKEMQNSLPSHEPLRGLLQEKIDQLEQLAREQEQKDGET